MGGKRCVGCATGDYREFPSIAWANDRWVLRYQAGDASGVRIRTGSFEGESSGVKTVTSAGTDAFMNAAATAGLIH